MDETIEVTIVNWDKFQPPSDRLRHRHWFKLKNDLPGSVSLSGLTPEQKWIWVCLLAQASRKDTGTFRIVLKSFAGWCGVEPSQVRVAIDHFATDGALTVNCQSTDRNLTVRSDQSRSDQIRVDGKKNNNNDTESEIQKPASGDPLEPFLQAAGIPVSTVKLWVKRYGNPWVCDTLLSIAAEFDVGDSGNAYKQIPKVVRVRQMLEKRWEKLQASKPKKYEWEEKPRE